MEEDDLIVFQTRDLLNNLTLGNFNESAERLTWLTATLEDTPQRIATITKELFNKAIDPIFEPDPAAFASLYALLLMFVVNKSDGKVSTIFRKQIQDQCLMEFHKINSNEDENKAALIKLKYALGNYYTYPLEKVDPEERSGFQRRKLGMVRFIGELYNSDLLSSKLVMDCVEMLLCIDEEKLQCLCLLLTIVGPRLEEQVGILSERFDNTFAKMGQLIEDEKLSFGIRSAIKDVLYTRMVHRYNWHRQSNPQEEEGKLLDDVNAGAKGGSSNQLEDIMIPFSNLNISSSNESHPPGPAGPLEIDPSQIVENISKEFFFSQNFDDTIDWIQKKFPEDQVGVFIGLFSRKIAENSKAEEQKLAGSLVKDLISRRLVSKEKVLHVLSQGVISDLPDIQIDAPMTISYLAVFLVEIFCKEQDILWLEVLVEPLEKENQITSIKLFANIIIEILEEELGKEIVFGYLKGALRIESSQPLSNDPPTPLKASSSSSEGHSPQSPAGLPEMDPSQIVQNISKDFFFTQNFDATIDEIQEKFPGDQIGVFIELFSRKIAENSKADQQKLAGILVKNLVSRRGVSKEKVMNSIMKGVFFDLPDIQMNTPMAVSHLAVFLVEIFSEEKGDQVLKYLGKHQSILTKLMASVEEELSKEFS